MKSKRRLQCPADGEWLAKAATLQVEAKPFQLDIAQPLPTRLPTSVAPLAKTITDLLCLDVLASSSSLQNSFVNRTISCSCCFVERGFTCIIVVLVCLHLPQSFQFKLTRANSCKHQRLGKEK